MVDGHFRKFLTQGGTDFVSQLGDFLSDSQLLHVHLTEEEQIGYFIKCSTILKTMIDKGITWTDSSLLIFGEGITLVDMEKLYFILSP
jgi:hypothetical protein